MKDQTVDGEKSGERTQRRAEEFNMSLHQAKPPLSQKDRSFNR